VRHGSTQQQRQHYQTQSLVLSATTTMSESLHLRHAPCWLQLFARTTCTLHADHPSNLVIEAAVQQTHLTPERNPCMLAGDPCT
jgi:hypothetical protein